MPRVSTISSHSLVHMASASIVCAANIILALLCTQCWNVLLLLTSCIAGRMAGIAIGLKNLRNTCFVNPDPMLQCILLHCYVERHHCGEWLKAKTTSCCGYKCHTVLIIKNCMKTVIDSIGHMWTRYSGTPLIWTPLGP